MPIQPYYLYSMRLTIFICIVITVALFSCKDNMEVIDDASEFHDPQIETGQDVEIFYSEHGIVQAKIVAKKVIRNLNNAITEMPEGVTVFFYEKDMVIDSKLTADYGEIDEKKELMKVTGNVVLTNSENERLDAEELIWDQKREKIFSEKYVKITTADEIIHGQGFESDQEFKKYRIKNIQGTLKLNEKEQEN